MFTITRDMISYKTAQFKRSRFFEISRDIVHYRLSPLALKLAEYLETSEYNRQKKLVFHKLAEKKFALGHGHLFLTDGRGGEIDRRVESSVAVIEEKGGQAWILSFQPLKRRFLLSRGQVQSQNGKAFAFPTQYAEMVSHLQSLGLAKLYIHHIRYLPFCFLHDIPDFTSAINVLYHYVIHDFIAFCPRLHLIKNDFLYCGMPEDVNQCTSCIRKNGSLTVAPRNIALWRENAKRLLSKAALVMAPCHDAAERHRTILGEIDIAITPPATGEIALPLLPPLGEDDPYIVAVMGRLNRHTGANILLECALDVLERNLPLRFVVIGNASHAHALREAGVLLTSYGVPAGETIRQHNPSILFIPGAWPEPYGETIIEAWRGGCFPVAFDLGAPAELIKASGEGKLLPASMASNARLINDALVETARNRHRKKDGR